MTIADKIKGVFSGHKDTEPTGTTTGTHMGTGTGAGTGEQHSNVTTQQRTVRAPDHHVPDGTAAGRTLETQREHADTMPNPEMESQVWPNVHTKYHEASKEARLTNQNAKLAEEELEKLRLAQSDAHDATARQQQLREEAARAQQQFGQFDGAKDAAARAAQDARAREAQVAQMAQEADMAKRAALEKQRAAQGLGPEGQAAERRLQATAAEIEANKRRAGEVQQQQHTLEQLEQQRLEAERNTRRYAQTLVQEKQRLGALEQELQAARQRIHDGEAQLNHLKGLETEIGNKIRTMGGKESPLQALRQLEAHHNGLVQRATAAQAALEEHRRAQQARLAEARQAEEYHRSLLSRLDPANADVLRAKQEAERLAAQARENEARAHQLAQHHQGILGEVETHTRTLQAARTDAERHMQLFHKYENEAEAAHGRKHERWMEANDLVNQMGESETTKFSSMQDKIKNFGSRLLHGGQTGGDGTTTTTEHHMMGGAPGQATTHTSTTGGHTGVMGGPVQRMEQRAEHGAVGTKQPGTVGIGGHRVVAEE